MDTGLVEITRAYRRFLMDERRLWSKLADRDVLEELPPSSALKAIVDETAAVVRRTATDIDRAGWLDQDVDPADRLRLLAESLSQRKNCADLMEAARSEHLEGELAELREFVLDRHKRLQPYLESLWRVIVKFSEAE